MKRFWKLVEKWWLVVAIAFVLQGLSVKQAYVDRGYLAYGGEYLLVPIALLVIYMIESVASEFHKSDDEKMEG